MQEFYEGRGGQGHFYLSAGGYHTGYNNSYYQE